MPVYGREDCMGSDDPELEELIRLTEFEYVEIVPPCATAAPPSSSTFRSSTVHSSTPTLRGPSGSRSRTPIASTSKIAKFEEPRTSALTTSTSRALIESQLNQVVNSIRGLDAEIKGLQAQRSAQAAEERRLRAQLKDLGNGKRMIDYVDTFEWSEQLLFKMDSVFGIKGFRLCQQGVCNANMDARDIICIMPTGGGKSLTYQLPALISVGTTIVVSPLISLMKDQMAHLQEHKVDAVSITSDTSVRDRANVIQRLKDGNSGIKLCYVTPERINNSAQFKDVLRELYQTKRIARFVIDEAHCVSQQGNDFRPDYKALSLLRKTYPHVPILALSATCPPVVLKDLCSILRLPPLTTGRAADTTGTVYFAAPLYRKNLHYRVVPKPQNGEALVKMMVEYILAEHAEHSGIVYCFSKKDTEMVATQLFDMSGRKIKTAAYHSEVPDAAKNKVHDDWRAGVVKVICATTAFGMGIDKADVRFVLHHIMSKTVENFYQESGRAGRDGQDADCILYYRGLDIGRYAGMVENSTGRDKLRDMIKFGQEYKECRKTHFARYFSEPEQIRTAAWSSESNGAREPCGHCDNCTRAPGSVETRDVTLDAWRILRVMRAVCRLKRHKSGFTAAQLCACVRGVGAKRNEVNLDELGGKVELSKTDTEHLVMDMLVAQLITEDYRTSHSPRGDNVNLYLRPGTTPDAERLAGLSKAQIEAGAGKRVLCTFVQAAKSGGKGKGKATEKDAAAPDSTGKRKRGRPQGSTGKGKERATAVDEEEDGDAEDSDDDYGFGGDSDDAELWASDGSSVVQMRGAPRTPKMREQHERAVAHAKFLQASNERKRRLRMNGTETGESLGSDDVLGASKKRRLGSRAGDADEDGWERKVQPSLVARGKQRAVNSPSDVIELSDSD